MYSLYHVYKRRNSATLIGKSVRLMLIGEWWAMSMTFAFGVLSLVGYLTSVSNEIQSAMRLSMFALTIYSTNKLSKRTQALEDAVNKHSQN